MVASRLNFAMGLEDIAGVETLRLNNAQMIAILSEYLSSALEINLFYRRSQQHKMKTDHEGGEQTRLPLVFRGGTMGRTQRTQILRHQSALSAKIRRSVIDSLYRLTPLGAEASLRIPSVNSVLDDAAPPSLLSPFRKTV